MKVNFRVYGWVVHEDFFDWGLRKREFQMQIQSTRGREPMSDRVVLPSLSLPKKKTHWMVMVVVVSSITLLVLGGTLFMLLYRQQAERDAIVRAESEKLELAKAQAEKAKADVAKAILEKEKAAADAKKKELEAKAALIAKQAAPTIAPSEKKGAPAPGRSSRRRWGKRGGPAVASKTTPAAAAPATQPAAPPKPARPSSKASSDIDAILKGF
jgi:hypothetical protein